MRKFKIGDIVYGKLSGERAKIVDYDPSRDRKWKIRYDTGGDGWSNMISLSPLKRLGGKKLESRQKKENQDLFVAGEIVKYIGPETGIHRKGSKAIVLGYTKAGSIIWLAVTWVRDNLYNGQEDGEYGPKDFVRVEETETGPIDIDGVLTVRRPKISG
jgi:hypothetical protein